MILAAGERAGIVAWNGREAWVNDAVDLIASDRGREACRRRRVSWVRVMEVARDEAAHATSTSGGDVATAHYAVGRRLGVSKSVVERARRVLRDLDLSATIAVGRYLTTQERRTAGNRQIRAASTRVLKHPPDPVFRRRRRSRDVLPLRGYVTPLSTVVKRSPRRSVDNFPRPIWAQRLAADLDRQILPRLVPHEHIGSLVDGLIHAGIPTDATSREVLDALDALRAPSSEIRRPLAWFLHQIRKAAAGIWSTRDRLERAAAPHRHDFRAMLSPTTRGCLTCPETREIP